MAKEIDYRKICFVITPFNTKKVDDKDVNFDVIYEQIFLPAIAAVPLPEEEGGGTLQPVRTDKDYFSGDIGMEMHLYLRNSRFAMADISGLNANVFYELGVRHASNESGTAIFRQNTKQPPPFDISHIKAFPYEYEPQEHIEKSRQLIIEVLTKSLQYNRIDSPVQMALAAQQQLRGTQTAKAADVDKLMLEATNALRNDDVVTAIDRYKKVLQQTPNDHLIQVELGLLYKQQEQWKEAATAFETAVNICPGYSEAWRELGIAQNKIFNKQKEASLPNGEEALRKALALNPEDFDAYASLGGVYKRLKMYDRAAEMYGRSLEVSNGHPYPLLNALVLQVREKGPASLTAQQKLYLRKSEVSLRKQVSDQPPYNAPFSFFDLSPLLLFLGKPEEATKQLDEGLAYCDTWHIETHYNTLALMEGNKDSINGLSEILSVLKSLLPEEKSA